MGRRAYVKDERNTTVTVTRRFAADVRRKGRFVISYLSLVICHFGKCCEGHGRAVAKLRCFALWPTASFNLVWATPQECQKRVISLANGHVQFESMGLIMAVGQKTI